MQQNLNDTAFWNGIPRLLPVPGRRAWLTVLAGDEVGRVYSLDEGLSCLGRCLDSDLVCCDPQVSRQHIEFRISPDGRAELRDTGSTNGTRVGAQKVTGEWHELHDGSKIEVGGTLVLRFSFRDLADERFERELYEALTRDALTGVYNKRYFELRFEQEFRHAKRHHQTLGLVVIDLDDFKAVNDDWGHAAGDRALRSLAQLLDQHLRDDELIARYGGEEFVLLLRESSHLEALMCAERLRRLIVSADFSWKGHELCLTASFGVATTEGQTYESMQKLFIDADEELYRAKHAGKNQVSGRKPAA
jgi:diguanylate cyclase (GGDEF)-like protein